MTGPRSAVLPLVIVFLPPSFDQHFRFRQRIEYYPVKQFIPQGSVERFVTPVLPGVSRSDEHRRHPQALEPLRRERMACDTDPTGGCLHLHALRDAYLGLPKLLDDLLKTRVLRTPALLSDEPRALRPSRSPPPAARPRSSRKIQVGLNRKTAKPFPISPFPSCPSRARTWTFLIESGRKCHYWQIFVNLTSCYNNFTAIIKKRGRT